MSDKYFQMEVSPLWSLMSQVKSKVKDLMERHPAGLVNFTVMVVSELMENAIKYREAKFTIDYRVNENILEIIAQNNIK